jgi:hypothetical protein
MRVEALPGNGKASVAVTPAVLRRSARGSTKRQEKGNSGLMGVPLVRVMLAAGNDLADKPPATRTQRPARQKAPYPRLDSQGPTLSCTIRR